MASPQQWNLSFATPAHPSLCHPAPGPSGPPACTLLCCLMFLKPCQVENTAVHYTRPLSTPGSPWMLDLQGSFSTTDLSSAWVPLGTAC